MIDKTLLRALNGHITDEGLQALCDAFDYSYSEAKLTCCEAAVSWPDCEQRLVEADTSAAKDGYDEGYEQGYLDGLAEAAAE